ncbi:MAG: hypothetical protein ONB16_05515 [candidate division KSB1 bacterium]|nr:hypothetical protein [candidate division KSB1 bacterium]
MVSTLDKVKRLEKYLSSTNSTIDPVIETTLSKLLSREFNRLFELKTHLSNELLEFEKHYNMKSNTFYQRFQAGELGDAMDFIEWAATLEMLANVDQKLELLEVSDAK